MKIAPRLTLFFRALQCAFRPSHPHTHASPEPARNEILVEVHESYLHIFPVEVSCEQRNTNSIGYDSLLGGNHHC